MNKTTFEADSSVHKLLKDGFMTKTMMWRIGVWLVSGSLTLSVQTTRAANIWDGGLGNDGNWNTPANWDNDSVPTFPVALTFAGSIQTPNTNNLTGITVNGFLFDAAAGIFTIDGNLITLGGNIGFTANPSASITQTINLPMALSGARTLTSEVYGNVLLGGVLSGSGSLISTGSGTNTLSGNNTFTNGVTLNAGTLKATTFANVLGTGAAATLRLNGGTLHLANDSALAYNRNTVVSNDVMIVPDRLTAVGTSITHTLGTLSISNQTLNVAKGPNITGTSAGQVTFGATTLTGDPVFSLEANSYVQLNTSVTEVGGFRKVTLNGSGSNPMLILNGTGAWTGGTEVNGTGFLRCSGANSLGASGSTATLNGTGGIFELRVSNAATGRNVAFKGNSTFYLRRDGSTVFDMASVTVDPSVVITLTVDRTSGGSGYVQTLNAPLTLLGASTLNVTAGNSCSAAITSGITLGGTFTVNPTANLSISGVIDDGASTYGIVKTGAGLLTLSGANKYKGGTTVSAGRLLIGSQAAATNAGAVTVNGGIYDLGGLAGVTNGAVTMTSGTISNGTLTATSYTFSGGTSWANLASAGALTQSGNITTLFGNNTYSGGTTINGGILVIPTTAQLPGWNTPGGFSVANGAGLAVGNAVTDGNVVTMLANGTFSAGAGFGFDTTLANRSYASVFADTGAGALGFIKLGPNTLTLSPDNTYSGGTAILGGTLSVPSDSALGGAGGGLIISNNAAFQFTGDMTLNNRPVVVRNNGQIIGDAGKSLTLTNDLTVASGSLTVTGACSVALGGNNVFLSSTWLQGGSLTFQPTSSNVFNAAELRVGHNPGSTGCVTQVGGYVAFNGANNGLLLGNLGGEGTYTLDGGGILRALPSSANRGLMLGVNHFSTGTFYMVSGVLTGTVFQISRTDSAATNSAGYYYQSGGTAGFNTLNMAGNLAYSANNYALLSISNGTFYAASFSGLAAGNSSTGRVYIGNGAIATLGAFPTARGPNAYAELLFDGATLSPAGASATYMSGLSKAFITDLGATFNVPGGRNITVAQVLEDKPGATGDLTKAGTGVLTLAGANLYTGNTTINDGVLSIPNAGTLPGWNVAGRYTVASGAALAFGNVYVDSDIATILATGNYLAGSSLGFDTTAGNRTYSSVLADWPGGAMGLVKLGANTLTLDNANTYTGWTIVHGNNGTGLVLSNATGAAIQGGLQLGAVGDTAGNVYLKTLFPDQFGPNSVLFLNKGTGVNSTPVFELLGNNQVVAGLSNAGTTYIENTQAEPGYGGSILTVSNSVDNSYNSVIRNMSSGGIGTLGLTKDGPAALTLSGAGITYTGPTLVKNGTLILTNTTALGSAVTIQGGQLLLASPTAMNSKAVTNGVDGGLGFLATNVFTIGGLNGSGNFALTNDAGAGVALTINTSNPDDAYSGALSGSGSLVKLGIGDQALSGASTFSGGVVLGNGTTSNISTSSVATASSGGFVTVGHNQALGTGPLAMKGTQLRASVGGLVLQNDIDCSISGGFRFGGSQDLEFSGNVVVDGVRAFGNYSLNRTLTLSGASISVTAGSALNFEGWGGATANGTTVVTGSITGEGAVSVNNNYDNGTVMLSGVNTYSGDTTIRAGTLSLSGSGSITPSSNISVASGATFNVAGLSSTFVVDSAQTLKGFGTVAGNVAVAGGVQPGDAFTIGTLAMNGNVTFQASSSATFDLGSLTGVGGNTNDLLDITGDLNADGTIRINVTDTLNTSGSYCLIKYTGSRSGTFAVTVNGRYTATLDYATPGEVNVSFTTTATKALTWKGTAGYTAWDQGVSTNWNDGATMTEFFALDNVTFDGTADDNSALLSVPLYPSSLTVSGGSDITLSGSGSIGGPTGLAKSGAGTLTLATVNDFTGATTVSGGKVRLGSATALGASSSLTLSGGAAISGSDSVSTRTLAMPYTLASDVTLGDATDSAALTLSATNTLTGSRTITTPGTTAVTMSGVVVESGGSFGITKAGSGTLTLNKANTFSGNSTVEAGMLDLGSPTTGSSMNSPVLTIKSGATTKISGTGSALGDTTDVIIEAGGFLDSTKNDTFGGLSGAGTVRNTSTAYTLQVNNGNETTEFSGTITNTGSPLSLQKNGAGTLTLSGVSTYAATTVIDGTLRKAGADALPSGTPLTLGATTTAGKLDLTTFSQTIGSLNVNSTSITVTNNIVVAAGQTLLVTGNVTVGVNVNSAKTVLAPSGGGNVQVANPGGTFKLGIVSLGNDNRGQALVDLSGLSSFSLDLGAGALTVAASGDNSAAYPCILTLAPSNTLNAATVTVGASGIGAFHEIRLGPVANSVFANTVNIGIGSRDYGRISFAGNNGAVTLRGLGGVGRANVALGVSAASTTGYIATNVFDVIGHESDLLIGTLAIGNYPVRVGAWRSTFSFDQGVLDVSNVVMSSGCKSGTSGISTLNLGGGIANIGSLSISSSTATGIVNVAGGTVTLGGDIVKQAGGRAMLTLSGGTLDMQSHSIGNASDKLDVVTFTGGRLMNLAGFNGGDPLVKTGIDTLEIAGANTYTGTNSVMAGTLFMNGTFVAESAVMVTNNATLGGIGTITGAVSVASAGTLSPGTNSVGTLTVGTLTLSSNATYVVQLGGTDLADYDRCVVSTGAINIGNSILSVSGAEGFVPQTGDLFTIIRNVPGSAVTGRFTSGTMVKVDGIPGRFEILYTGGFGQDVVLRYAGRWGTLISVF